MQRPIPVRSLVLLALGATVWAAAPAAGALHAANPRDVGYENFLRAAEVVENIPVGEGITEPRKLTLQLGDLECHAIYKDVDLTHRDQVVRTNRYELEFSDRWAYEVAAYRLDRYLGIGLVPVTVAAAVDGRQGSVQLWIEDHMTMTEALDRQLPSGDSDLLVQRLTTMFVFDALIGNIDRNYGNVLVKPGEDSFYLIDHSRAFRTSRSVPKPRKGTGAPIPVSVVERLEEMNLQDLEELLGDLLSRDQLKAVVARRDRLLKVLAKSELLPERSAAAGGQSAAPASS